MKAVFLDRDGVLIEDADLLIHPRQIRILDGVPNALGRLHSVGFKLIMVSNQAVVARGLCTEADVDIVHRVLQTMITGAGGPVLDGIYFCPHHPNATLVRYRVRCECRKPRPGLILRAAREHSIDLSGSFMVGDRMSDVIAGGRAGCRSVLLRTGKDDAPGIETIDEPDVAIQPDHMCSNLTAATAWIEAHQ